MCRFICLFEEHAHETYWQICPCFVNGQKSNRLIRVYDGGVVGGVGVVGRWVAGGTLSERCTVARSGVRGGGVDELDGSSGAVGGESGGDGTLADVWWDVNGEKG